MQSRYVILATGQRGNPSKLGVPWEDWSTSITGYIVRVNIKMKTYWLLVVATTFAWLGAFMAFFSVASLITFGRRGDRWGCRFWFGIRFIAQKSVTAVRMLLPLPNYRLK